jgi:pyruvate formate lyase activating enzyme
MIKTVQCELCPNECVLENGQHSRCRARMNKDGTLYSLVYGKPCAVHVDPIEKKPFFHFLPGTTSFSIATAGCVLSCKFCQNWQISQANPEDTDTYDLPPDKVVKQAINYGSKSITYTYTEPTVFYEYMYDTAVIAKKYNIRNTMHSCGYMKEKPLRKSLRFIF